MSRRKDCRVGSSKRRWAMRQETMFRTMVSDSAACRAKMEVIDTTRDVNRTARSVALAADRVMHLVRQAMKFLESDRQAALRCLSDAATLLGADPQDSDAGATTVLKGLQPGGLARWQARRALSYIEENLGSKIAIRELAALVSFSKSH